MIVTFEFHNGSNSQYDLAWTQALQPHSIKADFYVNSARVPTDPANCNQGTMCWNRLTALAAAGNEIGGETVDNVAGMTVTSATTAPNGVATFTVSSSTPTGGTATGSMASGDSVVSLAQA